MKKSEKIHLAMLCVADDKELAAELKLEVLEWLMGEKSMNELLEKYEEEKKHE